MKYGYGHWLGSRHDPLAWVPGNLHVDHIVYARDFRTGQQYPKKHTFARTSAAWWYRHSVPSLTAYSSGEERIQSDIGQLIETFARTNLVKAMDFTGATVGTVGSGGTLPTGASLTNLSADVISVTTNAAGAEVLRIRLYRTNSSGGNEFCRLNFTTSVDMTSGEDYTGGVIVDEVSNAGTAQQLQLIVSGPASGQNQKNINADGSYDSVTHTATSDAAGVGVRIGCTLPNGETWDTTYDIVLPSLFNLSSLPSVVITSGSEVTAAAESLSAVIDSRIKTLAISGLYIDSYPDSATDAVLCQVGTDGNCVRILYRPSNSKMFVEFYSGGVSQAALDMGVVSLHTVYSLTTSWEDNNFAASLDKATAVTDTLGTAPTISGSIHWGNNSAGTKPAGVIPGVAVGYSTVIPPASI